MSHEIDQELLRKLNHSITEDRQGLRKNWRGTGASNPMSTSGDTGERVRPVQVSRDDAGRCKRLQGNAIQHLYWLVEKAPDSALTHVMAFMGGAVTALAIATAIALAS